MRLSSIARPAVLAAALALGGCAQLIAPGDPPRIYHLTPKSTFDEDLPSVDWQLTVSVPIASAAIETTRIAVMLSPVQVDYFARATWTDRAPVMVQTLMVESFENSDRIVAVGRETIGLRPNFVLQSELREFQSELQPDGTHVIRTAISAKLVQLPERQIVASQLISRTAVAPSGDMNSIVAAFDEALGRMLKELVGWTLREGERAFREGDAQGRGGSAAGVSTLPVQPRSRPPARPPGAAPMATPGT